ncbi:glutamine amidotransferase [Veronia nyctiphanis]|uniref:Glutamine amidotransferase n=1 Tax=Veronia nyctiphanis TaxID=1278244 RepID=A0A4Q0YPG4_9GAMM|nr:glutamine amidotransferase [Veronia nyctiphanis]RXJ72405.1 glutamine amidotransferase [Veronia nyctiphanis]
MKIGILLCDEHHPDSLDEFGTYDNDFIAMLGEDHFSEFKVWRCYLGEFPSSVFDCDGWVFSGSKTSVYELESWIDDTCDFIVEADRQKRSMLGICFGHQIIHMALGGDVKKSDKGWGVGVKLFSVLEEYPPLRKDQHISLIVVHQDQVLRKANGFKLIAGSGFCPNAITAKGDHILTFQPHPEFTSPFFRQLAERLRQKADSTLVDLALASLDKCGEGDRPLAISMIQDFFLRHKIS